MRSLVVLALIAAPAFLSAQPPASVSITDKVDWFAHNSITLRSIDPRDQDFADLRPLAQAIGSARIVLLGGPDKPNTVDAKDRLVRFLHQEMGFDILAGDVPLADAEELDWAMARGKARPADLQEELARMFLIPHPPPPAAPKQPNWDSPGLPGAHVSAPPAPAAFNPTQQAPQSDILNYARATYKTGRPLHIAGTGDGPIVSDESRYAGRLFQFAARIDPHLALPATRNAVQSLLGWKFPRLGRNSPLPPKTQWDAIAQLYDGLGRLPPNSPDAPEASFHRHMLENLGYTPPAQSGRPKPIRNSLIWMAKEWHPESKIVVWSRNLLTRNTPVCLEFGTAVYTIGWSSIVNANEPLELLAAGPRPSLVPVQGDLESLLHAAGKAYSFVDFRGLPRDHWLRQPLAAALLSAPATLPWPQWYDGLFSIDLTVPKEPKK
jgi:hypothetical protein